jgi:NDP-sugar pyrophosphorylase family protein
MNRERLTITLRNDLLKALDGEIDGERLRNRSHAIEYFLSKALGLKTVKVLILAGGNPVHPHNFDDENRESSKEGKSSDGKNSLLAGVKVRGVNFESEKKSLPKAMVKIAGKPLLEQTLQKLKAAKLTEVYISLGQSGEVIEDYFGDGSHMGLHITYIKQKSGNQGNAQPILQAKEFFNSGFLLLYGDVLSDIDYGDLVEFHRAQKSCICTMALSSQESVSQWGLAKLQGNKVVAFEEKPKNPKTFSRLVNAGIYMMETEIFRYITSKTNKLESDVFPRLAEEGKLGGYPYEGLWLDIAGSAAYRQAVKELKAT